MRVIGGKYIEVDSGIGLFIQGVGKGVPIVFPPALLLNIGQKLQLPI